MRLYAVIASTVLILCCINATTAVGEMKGYASLRSGETPTSTNIDEKGGSNKRLLGSDKMTESEFASDEERSLRLHLKFRFWKLIGMRPKHVYYHYFGDMSPILAASKPKFPVYEQYNSWFWRSKPKKSAVASVP
ncbi:secreted RxLR effector peptide protein, putative [Phytophthora infestans T30-4]|uniref:Secreted RxLR effector peptide protein, putative n=2 Tax=Phytophthora infestans TaxID=4787 RepID=D0NEW0_PHYIT|nr:secreted RxLR effector peptide protein, putative [Phytophthora infestans T30-4]EEY56749.1 secreted RxLR effector peptide protein, putative [Phytophthora infestans T30-4]KAF4129004.1 hypothetical protein GN958_ATG21804 [Phytophthora infestans]|eukprot:XP_002902077.1 secreted RxLR effector peptide protein, putative [Phytophthora infestans T30-4]